jgi:hypothetical protein
MELIQTKSLLAKLMATENLVIEQRKTPTACFDVKNRILTVPMLDNKISPELYDLFMGHEVGHALHTPMDGMIKAREEKIPMSVTNVLEDVRIEKKIKNKYPGIRISFVKGYRNLIERNFFETNGINLNTLNFIDRINLYSKGGPTQGIIFSDFEKTLLSKIETTETYDDVIVVAREVVKYMKEEQEKNKKEQAEDTEFTEDEGFESFDSEGYDDSKDETEEESYKDNRSSDGKPEHENEESDGEDSDQLGNGPDDGLATGFGIESFTDEAYRRNENKLFSAESREVYYGNIPKIDLAKAIVDYKYLWKRHKDFYREYKTYYADPTDNKGFQKVRIDAKKVVGYLAKEFELRKNADQLKRASVAKTGDLNMAKIYSYGFAEDLFKKITVLPGGKSHGLVMFLDWSGSMSDHMPNTIKQLINLVMFCKKVNIPFEVYAFTSEYEDETAAKGPYSPIPVEGDIHINPYKLMNVLSSRMSAVEFSYAGAALVGMAPGSARRPSFMQLGGTPLNEAIISAIDIIPEFQKKYKLQVVNTIFLTDGDGHSLNHVWRDNENLGRLYPQQTSSYRNATEFVIRDPKTKNEVRCERNTGRILTSSYIQLLKLRTNCNIVGFYVLSGRELTRELYNFYPKVVDQKPYKDEFRKNKSLVVTNSGYDEYYLLRSEGLDTDDDVSFEVKENATTRGLVSAFSKYAGNRLSNRVVLNRFIGLIS